MWDILFIGAATTIILVGWQIFVLRYLVTRCTPQAIVDKLHERLTPAERREVAALLVFRLELREVDDDE